MEKYEQSDTSAKEPRAKVHTTLKAYRVDPAKSAKSRQQGVDRQVVTADVRKGGF